MGILDGIVDWLATQVMNLLDLASTSVLGALGCNMDTFKRYFPAASAMYEIFIWTAIGLVLLNLVWQLYRCYGAGFDIDTENPINHAALGFLLRLLYTKSSTTFSQSIYNERRTRLCCLVIPQKYNSNPALSRHLLYCYLGTKRGQNAYPFQKNCTHCTANLENILLCNSMDGL